MSSAQNEVLKTKVAVHDHAVFTFQPGMWAVDNPVPGRAQEASCLTSAFRHLLANPWLRGAAVLSLLLQVTVMQCG